MIMKYTKHALKRFAERYPDLNLVEEDPTFKPATKRVMKALCNKSRGRFGPRGVGTPVSNNIAGAKMYVSKSGCVAVVRRQEGEDVVVTFYGDPFNPRYTA